MDKDTVNQLKEELHTQLLAFIVDSPLRTQWLNGNYYSIYVRKVFYGSRLDIASISIDPRGRGIFKNIVLPAFEYTARECGFKYLFVENVQTTRFADFFRKRGGWEEIGVGGIPSFRKVIWGEHGKYYK